MSENLQIDSNKKLKKFFAEEFGKIRKEGFNTRKPSKYFGEIGSTTIEDIEYKDQLKIKQKAIETIFSNPEFRIEKSPKIMRYRLKMEFVCSYDPFHQPNNRFGQRKAKRFNWVVDLDDCILINSNWFKKTRDVYSFIHDCDIPNYDLVSQKGNLRYLVLRNYEDQAFLSIVTKEKLDNSLLEKIWRKVEKIGFFGIVFLHNPSKGDLATGEKYKEFGENYLQVELNGKKLKSNYSNFFQNNIYAFRELLKFVRSEIRLIPDENKEILYDLYCGVGTFGIALNEQFQKIIGIDILEENISTLELNLKSNNIKNYQYFVENLNSENVCLDIKSNQTLIVDPPRAGLEKHGINHVFRLNPKFIVYVSCNPITQMQDLNEIGKKYKINSQKAFDMFPLTYHMENVLILEKI